jgi:hypothetical protein
VLVARSGKVLADRAYGVPAHPTYMPGTTVPNFSLGGAGAPIYALVKQLIPPTDTLGYPARVTRYIGAPIGWHKTVADKNGAISSNVDELYRFSLGLESARIFGGLGGDSTKVAMRDDTRGWIKDTWRGQTRLSAFGTEDGKRNAFVRYPDRRISIIILTDRDDVDARALSAAIAERLIPLF